jgi:hypothetical protein
MVIATGVISQGGFAPFHRGSGIPPLEQSRPEPTVRSTRRTTSASPDFPPTPADIGGIRHVEET